MKTRSGFEVDFLAHPPAGKPLLIQVAADLTDAATRGRELRALSEAKTLFPQAPLHLVTLTPEFAANVPQGITVHPAWQWLLTISFEGAV